MHIVVLPFPTQGHLNPCLMLARLLASQGFTFTFVLTEELASKFEEGGSSEDYSIRHATIRDENASTSSNSGPFRLVKALEMVDRLRPSFETLLTKLVSSPLGVSCIIFDCFVLWSKQVASKLSIPAFAFYTTNAHSLSVSCHTGDLVSRGLDDLEKMVDDIPGLFPLQVCDLPQSILEMPSFAVSLTEDIEKTAGIIINTVSELEKEPLEVLRSKVPCYTIGPMTLMLDSEKLAGVQTVGLWAPERECLEWLDKRPNASVLFVAFGSLATMGRDQIMELAEGLEASEQTFLWVIRSSDTLSNLLPEGFLKRTKDRGLIISWAPQLEVLSHPAVGGFITHCGWNSLTENLSLMAVPMICWPQMAEQRLNKRLVVDKWKVGLELRDEGGIVKKAELERVVKELMQGEVGKELRKRGLEFKETILSAVQEGGSSKAYLEALGEDIRRMGLGGSPN
ncbi:hypothetical protein L7F22_012374 [Adiantum nelumboides]|nr:hypothetical protein [Adiantum nelumboides]